jgi:NAD(P)-dependent dehydrogenase (short-subunit alcohol dehydrogenase family)
MGAARAGDTGLNDFRRRTPWGRRARPDEIAYPILFLCSEWATYMTGHAMVVDGGMSVTASLRAEPPERWPDDPDM